MTDNPFDDENGRFLVLRNDEGQHSLWLPVADVPDGWDVVHGPAARASCLEYVEDNWQITTTSTVGAAE